MFKNDPFISLWNKKWPEKIFCSAAIMNKSNNATRGQNVFSNMKKSVWPPFLYTIECNIKRITIIHAFL